MGPTTQTFREVVQEPVSLAPIASGMAIQTARAFTFTFKTRNASDILLTVGPLDPKKFQHGDKVKVIVQRVGKRRAAGPVAR